MFTMLFVSMMEVVSMKGFMTLKETSEKWGISTRRINTLCIEGRVEGATKIGTMWVIPEDAKVPEDRRIKSGKYIKNKPG